MTSAATPSDAPTIDDFNAGRELARKYLQAVFDEDSRLAGRHLEHAVYPTGLLRSYLALLGERPEFAAGFDACLSSVIVALKGSVDCAALMPTHGAVYGPDYEFFDDETFDGGRPGGQGVPRANVIAFPPR